eukprot:TRINITY_DN3237_c0_g1_i3.p1 TRINITY_DN3237_c0_g1~~TRINITY_DN3237_c0_g1_i3.p1  ORF type:complete len:237 (+),score=11.91 TRINITY_DN3237_c0_g1_i3:85-795(+)
MCIRDRPSSHPSIHDQDIYSNFDYSGVLSQTAQSKFTTDHCDQVHPNDSFLDYLEFSENGGDKRIDEDTAYSIGLDDELYVFKQLPDSAFFDAKSSKKTTDREKIPQINAQSDLKPILNASHTLNITNFQENGTTNQPLTKNPCDENLESATILSIIAYWRKRMFERAIACMINPAEAVRRKKVQDYLAKKKRKIWRSHIKYPKRKTATDARERIHGRFLSREQRKERMQRVTGFL